MNKEYKLLPVMELSGMMGETPKRTILMHTRSCSVAEVVEADSFIPNSDKVVPFSLTNSYGIEEEYLLVYYYANAEKEFDLEDVEEISDEIIEYYKKYVDWEDRNIRITDAAVNN